MSETLYERPKYTERPCLRCKQPFPSAGNHNRLCRDCKSHQNRADSEYVAQEVEGWLTT